MILKYDSSTIIPVQYPTVCKIASLYMLGTCFCHYCYFYLIYVWYIYLLRSTLINYVSFLMIFLLFLRLLKFLCNILIIYSLRGNGVFNHVNFDIYITLTYNCLVRNIFLLGNLIHGYS